MGYSINNLSEKEIPKDLKEVWESSEKDLRENKDLLRSSEIMIPNSINENNVLSLYNNLKRKIFNALEEDHCAALNMQRVYFIHPVESTIEFSVLHLKPKWVSNRKCNIVTTNLIQLCIYLNFGKLQINQQNYLTLRGV